MEKKPIRLSELSYEHNKKGNIVCIKENDKFVPYIVLTNNYKRNVLLLRKDILNSKHRISDYSSYYENSEIDNYLNTVFLESIDDYSDMVVPTDIEITDMESIGEDGSGTITITRKVFLLSLNELGIKEIAQEGSGLDYFEYPENRLAYDENKLSSWWLRTPNTANISTVYFVNGNNKLSFTNANDLNGVRPAMCMSGDIPVEKINVGNGESFYIISNKNT